MSKVIRETGGRSKFGATGPSIEPVSGLIYPKALPPRVAWALTPERADFLPGAHDRYLLPGTDPTNGKRTKRSGMAICRAMLQRTQTAVG